MMATQPDRRRLIAIATHDGVTLLTHGGRARHFDLYAIDDAGGARKSGRLTLSEDQEPHLCGDGRPHPLDQVGVVIAGASGEGFVKHMLRRGITPVITGETDVARALAGHLAGDVRPADPPPHPHEHHEPE